MASRRLYVQLATTIKGKIDSYSSNIAVMVIRDVVLGICDDLSDNPNFDRDRFLKKCGLWKGLEEDA